MGHIKVGFQVFAERLCAYVGILKLGSKVFAGCLFAYGGPYIARFYGVCRVRFVRVVCFCRFDGVCGVFASRVTLCL